MRKCPFVGEAGQILVDALCRDCKGYHLQWMYPCVCEYGKVPVEPLGYKFCGLCRGHGYLREKVKE